MSNIQLKLVKKKSCLSTSGAPLAAGLPDAADMGSADPRTAGAGGAQGIALWGFSVLAWERKSGIRYNGVVVE